MQFFPNRRTIRLQDFDYDGAHCYFITICTYQRQQMFGEIQSGVMCLNDLGANVWAEWEKSFLMRSHYLSHAFVVMPNHLHGLFSITRPPGDAYNPARVAGFDRHPKDTISTMIGGFKGAITGFARGALNFDAILWQERFHEHVVRDWIEFENIRQYILNNPSNWRDDCFHA